MNLPSTPGYFITGTDTGIGKTRVSLALMSVLQNRGMTVLGMKPLATGASAVAGQGLRSADALALQAQGSSKVPYEWVNPCVYAPPIAPHIAAEEAHTPIRIAAMLSGWQALRQRADRVIVEGIGGWRVPLSRKETLADLVRALDIPVILVVGMRLGCLNHALLTAECIQADGFNLVAWVACYMQKECLRAGPLESALSARLAAPLLAVLPFQKKEDMQSARHCFHRLEST